MIAPRIVIGLTGNIGTGKSTIIAYLAAKGVTTLDADRIAHEVMAPGMTAYTLIVAAFGPEIVGADGAIDRAALGAIVFRDPQALHTLEAIVHPAVLERTVALLQASDAPVAVVEAIKLLEAQNLRLLCSEIWVVTASEATQLRRLMQSRGMRADEARRRLAAQSSQAEKVRQATRVFTNEGTPEQLYAQLDAAWEELVTKYDLEKTETMTDN
jgi:dephospho-CoA kinase